ncbi:hypothetical protein [Helicobacter trogontum]|uniref:Lipoprotein n=1 Tax=Helicobacter trogontum TaxID=50960 RepID=A0A4U8TAZ3_9HELI|nr:hypothetical protein [Helicobacter trogontum]MDY5185697.1 hypothetical protein [Helicobacter trogontum]TLD97029.1 hypothetical protein LS80_007720 [Helicobacter trogontum]
MRISAILAIFGILAIMFLLSGCSFKYFDPQFYKFVYLGTKYGGTYIYDLEIYNEILRDDFSLKDKLSNGYYLKGYYADEADIEYDIKRLGSRLIEFKKNVLYYIDNNGTKHIVKYNRYFEYTYIAFGGDEGRGSGWQEMTHSIGSKKFYFKNGEWNILKDNDDK